MSFDPRITAYFGDAVLRAGFMPLPHLFLRHYHQLGLSTNEAMFLLQVMEINWDLAAPPKTAGDLARRMGVDTRTIRRYSESIAKKKLIVLYDQFDERGAQIENGYDLSPLFARLGSFAPEPPISGSSRRHAQRDGAEKTRSEGADAVVTPPVDKTVTPPADKTVTPAPDTPIRPRADRSIRGRRIERSGLKQETHEDQNSMLHAAHISATTKQSDAGAALNEEGFSLRFQRSLDKDEIERSARVLQRIGIDQPVRSLLARAMAPEEVWGLWAYSLVKGWSVPLLISQVYDKRRKQPHLAADLPPEFLTLGEALLRQDDEIAERIVRHVVSHGAIDGRLPLPDGNAIPVAQHVRDALTTALSSLLPQPAAVARSQSGKVDRHGAWQSLWQSVHVALAGAVPPYEYETWLRETALLDVSHGTAIVGVPNVFARDTVASRYRDAIQLALAQHLGGPVVVEVVVGL